MGQYKHVRTGITCVYVALWLTILAILAVPLACLLRAAPLLLIAPLLVAAGTVLSMIGRILCLSVPAQVGATGLIYGAVLFDVAALLATVSGLVGGLPDLSAFSPLLNVIGMVLFVLFLKQLALSIGAKDCAVRASNLLNLSVGLTVVIVLTLFLPPMGLVALVLGLLGVVLYFQLLSGLKLGLSAA